MSKRSWFQFSLKTLLIVITLLCVGPGGYVVYEQRKAWRQRATIESLEVFGGLILYDDTIPRRSPTLRAILGDDKFETVYRIDLGYTAKGLTDNRLSDIALFSHLREIDLEGTDVTDITIQRLTRLKELRLLFLENTKVTRVGAERLKEELPNVTIILTEMDRWP
jgi:hypothetical protein